MLKETPSQTAGPYVHIGLTPNFADITGIFPEDAGKSLVNDKTLGERITVKGRIIDGQGTAIKDAVVEIWQADHQGLYNSPSEPRGQADTNFAGWGRCATDMQTGEYRFETIKPGRVPFADGRLQAPHASLWIVARGINIGLQTRLYFEDEVEANGQDPVLSRIEHKARADTLIARKEGDSYIFDVCLQGENETVFFDI
ncbi:protocatechuate 3,4-dioxygenase subunit alpha [Nitratireductor thuwali]|uniref:Protocatechuate 3,4-dioxygenase alpha chain n=1 Tax=Nitratireductor thuwali TaxID=2267699 RepID=A0ABY5MH40_9HYPH|nr:Protocatechuate 3,4-dioxygenase alpha chain [Nitratireductor thuwali]